VVGWVRARPLALPSCAKGGKTLRKKQSNIKSYNREILKIMRTGSKVLLGIALLFALAACKDDAPDAGGNDNTAETVQESTQPESSLRDDRFIELTFNVTATGNNDDPADDRVLQVTALAYCEEFESLGDEAYEQQCGAAIAHKIERTAEIYGCFEGSVPAVSSAVRNHEGLPQNGDADFCEDSYSDRYSVFTKDMLANALDLTNRDENYYTVTAIAPAP